MPIDVPLRCTCGKLCGSAVGMSPASGTRVVCYCDDCQAFVHFLGRTDVMDAWGGTEIFQMAPSRVRLVSAETLSCMRLSEKGLRRWYCGECKTPVGNTMGARFPFVGLISAFMDLEGRSRDEVLGELLAVQTKFATGTLPAGVRDAVLKVMARTGSRVARWWLTGAGSPSPFFDEKTREPRATPRVLTPEERRAL